MTVGQGCVGGRDMKMEGRGWIWGAPLQKPQGKHLVIMSSHLALLCFPPAVEAVPRLLSLPRRPRPRPRAECPASSGGSIDCSSSWAASTLTLSTVFLALRPPAIWSRPVLGFVVASCGIERKAKAVAGDRPVPTAAVELVLRSSRLIWSSAGFISSGSVD